MRGGWRLARFPRWPRIVEKRPSPLNDRMGTMLEKDKKKSDGQAGFRPNRSCVDHVYALGKIIQGRKNAGLTTYCFFLHVQKAYDTVWRNGL